MKTKAEEVSGRSYQQQATLGDFVPQILVYLGKRPRSRLWAAGCLRNQIDPLRPFEIYPRESFALAWLFLCAGFSAMRLQATTFLHARFRSTVEQRRHHDQQVDLVSSMETPNVELTGRGTGS